MNNSVLIVRHGGDDCIFSSKMYKEAFVQNVILGKECCFTQFENCNYRISEKKKGIDCFKMGFYRLTLSLYFTYIIHPNPSKANHFLTVS
jgi:hypothetical protein